MKHLPVPSPEAAKLEQETVRVPLARYDELIKKETIYDEIMKNKGVNVYLFHNEEAKV